MAIITQTDKRSGITYAYETTYYWDKEKQQSRSKRVCIGKVDPVSGEIIPTRGRAKKQLLDKLDVLECYEDEKRALRIGELLDKQADIYRTLGVALPTSSC